MKQNKICVIQISSEPTPELILCDCVGDCINIGVITKEFISLANGAAKYPPDKGAGCPEKYESNKSLILNLGLHDVMCSMIEPNSV